MKHLPLFLTSGFALATLLLWLVAWVVSQSSDSVSMALSNPQGEPPLPITLPYSAKSTPKYKIALYNGTINHTIFGPVTWNFIGDDCIRSMNVNGYAIELAVAKGNVCDIHRGIFVDLSPYIKPGVNSLAVIVEDFGGSYAFNILPLSPFMAVKSFLQMIFNVCVSGFFIWCACRFLRQHQVDNAAIGLFVLAAILSLHYLHISNDYTYTNDLQWHINYINYVSKHWLSPYGYSQGTKIQTTLHPPLYYYIAAALSRLNEVTINMPRMTILRFLSWVFFLVFNAFNLLTLRRSGFSGAGHYACVALLLLWPGNAHLASKINSEAMYYAFAAISFYYTITWYEGGKSRDLMNALVAAGISLMVRINAVIIFTMIGTVILITMLRGRLPLRTFFTKSWMIVCGILLLSFFFSFAGFIVSNTFTLKVDTTTVKLWQSPLTHYLSIAYSFEDPFIRDIKTVFLEYVLKTSAFGEYRWPSPQSAIFINYFMPAIFWYSVLPWPLIPRAQWRGVLPYVLYLLFSVLYLLYFAVQINDWPSQDARYIYPALILCLVVLFGKIQAFYTQRGLRPLSALGPALAAGLSLSSIYYFWNNFR